MDIVTDDRIMRETIDEISAMMRIDGTLQERCGKIREVFRTVLGLMPKIAANMNELTRKQ